MRLIFCSVLSVLILACGSDNSQRTPEDADANPFPTDATSSTDARAVDARPDAPTDAAVLPPDAALPLPPDAPPPECLSAADCDDDNYCTQNLCVGGQCQNPNQADGLVCSVGGANGRCRSGGCCTGCWDGATCATGTALQECGDAGSLCLNCDDDVACTNDSCLPSGACGGHSGRPAGTPCPDGHCVNGGVCVADSPGACGGADQPCCGGFTCSQSGTTCNLSTNTCEYCGGEDELCCLAPGPVYVCDTAQLDCRSEGALSYCRCGGSGEPCCADVISPCDNPGQCNMGVCYFP